MGKRKVLTQEQEIDVCEMYERVEVAWPVAESFGVSDQTIYRVLKDHGIKRTHRHSEKELRKTRRKARRLRQIGNKPKWTDEMIDEVVRLYESGMTCSKIGDKFDCSWMTIDRRLRERGVKIRCRGAHERIDADIEKQICEAYESGITNRKIAERFGIAPEMASRVAKRNGLKMRGRGNNSPKDGAAYASMISREARANRARKRFESVSDKVELLEYTDKSHVRVRCVTCGTEFNWRKEQWKMDVPCPACRVEIGRKAREKERERKIYERQQQQEAAREWLLSVPRVCVECGMPFYSEYDTAKYCSESCRHKAKVRRKNANAKRRGSHSTSKNGYKRRMRVKVTKSTYDRTVTLDAVYKKYRGRCCGCGCETVRSKTYDPRQATLDHKIALANNGTHTWDNVQLLCAECNSYKRDTGQMRLAIA